jgi:hypothetical protein
MTLNGKAEHTAREVIDHGAQTAGSYVVKVLGQGTEVEEQERRRVSSYGILLYVQSY